MKVMFDANIALDVFQQREPHQIISAQALSSSLSGNIHGSFPAHVVTTIYYILRKSVGNARAAETIRWMIETFEITPCDAEFLSAAAQSAMTDFEDAVVTYSARRAGCDVVVTRNTSDFDHSPILAVTPAQLLEMLTGQ